MAPSAFEFTLVPRDRLSHFLTLAAAARHPRSVHHRWGAAGDCRGVDAPARLARFADGSALPYDLLVAADGVRSPVRTSLTAQGLLRVSQRAEEEFRVKAFLAEPPAPPAAAAGGSDDLHSAWRSAIHWWHPDATGRPLLLGQPHWSGAFLFSLCLPTQEGWGVLATADAVQASHCPPVQCPPRAPAEEPTCSRSTLHKSRPPRRPAPPRRRP